MLLMIDSFVVRCLVVRCWLLLLPAVVGVQFSVLSSSLIRLFVFISHLSSYQYPLHRRIHAIRTYPYLSIWRGPLDLLGGASRGIGGYHTGYMYRYPLPG